MSYYGGYETKDTRVDMRVSKKQKKSLQSAAAAYYKLKKRSWEKVSVTEYLLALHEDWLKANPGLPGMEDITK